MAKAKTPPLDLRYGMPPGIVPKQAMQRRLCDEYIKDGDATAAALRAGYSEKTAKARGYMYVREHHDYIMWLQAQQAQANAKQIAIELEPVLQEIAKIAMVNEHDYLVIEPSKQSGQPPTVRRKRLDELTRDQMVPIRVRTGKRGGLDYTLRDKEGRLIDLVRHLGGFSEKIILEHRHRHLHAHLDLTDVPLDQLEVIESKMQQLMQGRIRGNALEAK